MRLGGHPLIVTCGALLVLAATGCGTTQSPVPAAPADQIDSISSLMSRGDRARLETLAIARTRQPSTDGYRIGPDDLLEIRIGDLYDSGKVGAAQRPGLTSAAIPDVSAAPAFPQGLRVTADGAINIPQLGIVKVEGDSPRELEERLARRLVSEGMLQRPQVSVAIVEYRSNVVAVVGSVQRPGVYPLTRPGATVADLIWAAGGPTRESGRLVQFAPGGTSPELAAARYAPRSPPPLRGSMPAQLASAQPVPGSHAPSVYSDAPALPVDEPVAMPSQPIRIDLEALLQATARGTPDLNPPVRPGDVINLAPAGTVLVGGWVEKPGPYQITRSLTLTGAVAAAGGHTFPAQRTNATVRRILGPGEEKVFLVDLDAITEGRAPDMPIIDGDVVNLPADGFKLVPYGAWVFVSTIFRVGWSLAVL